MGRGRERGEEKGRGGEEKGRGGEEKGRGGGLGRRGEEKVESTSPQTF